MLQSRSTDERWNLRLDSKPYLLFGWFNPGIDSEDNTGSQKFLAVDMFQSSLHNIIFKQKKLNIWIGFCLRFQFSSKCGPDEVFPSARQILCL